MSERHLQRRLTIQVAHTSPTLTATRISLELTALIQKAIGGPVMSEEELRQMAAVQNGEEEESLSEEVASDLTSEPLSAPDSISATDSDTLSTSNTTSAPSST